MGDLGKTFVARAFEWLPKVQKIAQSSHTDRAQKNAHQIVLPNHLQHTLPTFWNNES